MKKFSCLIILIYSFLLCFSQENDSIKRANDLERILNRINHHIGVVLPDIELMDIDGEIRKLSDFNQRVILLDLWATWCGPCIAKIPHQKKVYTRLREYGIDDFEWIKISVDTDSSAWRELVTSEQIPGINLIGHRKNIEEKYFAGHYPTYILLDEDKKVLGYDISGPDQGVTLDWLILLGLDGINCVEAWTSFFTPGLDSIKTMFLNQHDKYFYKYRND